LLSIQKIKKALEKVVDPELNFNIIDLGLVYDIKIEEKNKVKIKMTLTSPFCPLASMLLMQAKTVVATLPEVKDVSIDLVFEPQWNPSMAKGKAKEFFESRNLI
jgi:metal-sulfur cluster biosynthetic enzyme